MCGTAAHGCGRSLGYAKAAVNHRSLQRLPVWSSTLGLLLVDLDGHLGDVAYRGAAFGPVGEGVDASKVRRRLVGKGAAGVEL
jgi:hypothetical protein